MQPTTHNHPQARFAALTDRLFLGRVLAETYGVSDRAAANDRVEPAGWTPHQLLQMSAARAQNALA